MSGPGAAARRRYRSQLRQVDQYTGTTGTPLDALTYPITSAPMTARLRWLALLALFLGIVGAVVTFGILQARDQRRQHALDNEIGETEVLINFLDGLVTNLTAPPNCTLEGNVTITSNFSDAEFAVFATGDNTAEFQFNLTSLDPSSLVTLTIQDASGVVAYLSDIPAPGSIFQDDEFTVQNAADTSKQVMLDCSGISPATTQLMTVQDASGTVAYLSDIPTQSSVFLDDVFAVQNAADPTKEVMLDVSGVSAGTTRVMTVQDASGTIAYLSDITSSSPPYADDVFAVFDAGDPTALAKFNCSGISTATTVVMTVQDSDGTIAYLSDLPQITKVFVNISRLFPDPAFEGVTNLTQLGDLTWIEISFCGGGGGGGATVGGGGGSGAGIENMRIDDPTVKFDQFNFTAGTGGTGSTGSDDAGNGTASTLVGISSTSYFLDLIGGGGGQGSDAGTGGVGGDGDMAEGGIAGGAGAAGATQGSRGGINYPWRSGGGGSQTGSGADWQGGPEALGNGAASMFSGDDGVAGSTQAGFCAGGEGNAVGTPGGDGGDGAALFRYYIF